MPLANIERLNCFVEVADTLSFSRAAQNLHLSQPAVSRYIKELERATGTRLFDRVGRKVALTETGALLLERARKVKQSVEELEADAEGLSGRMAGQLQLGGSTVWEYLLPRVIGSFTSAHPGIRIMLAVANTGEIIDWLDQSRIHLGFVGDAPGGRSLDATPIAEDRLVIVAPAQHPLAKRRKVRPADLSGFAYVQREANSATARIAARYLAELGVVPQTTLELGSHEAVKSGVRAGLGLGIISRYAIAEEVALGSLVEIRLDAPPCLRPLYVLRNPARAYSAPQKAFIAHVLTAFRKS